MIEKHVKLGDLEWVHFDGVALDLESDIFTKFVTDIRKAQIIRGTGEKKIQSVEFHKYKPNQNHN
jgi:N-acetylneuraminate synthase